MDGSDPNENVEPTIMILERRKQRQPELSSTDIMKILRKRAAKSLRRGNNGNNGSSGDNGAV
jgi:hypothetical protein